MTFLLFIFHLYQIVWKGFTIDILDELKNIVNFSYGINSVNQDYGRQNEFGMWLGVVGDVANNISDIGVQYIEANPTRAEVFSFIGRGLLCAC